MNLEDRIASGAFTLIAEIGVNYYDIARQRGISPMEAAKLMCKEASEAGVHAVNFRRTRPNRSLPDILLRIGIRARNPQRANTSFSSDTTRLERGSIENFPSIATRSG